MKRIIERTEDGSATLFVPELNEHYHSVKGARTESQHIFIDMGFKASTAFQPRILEIGFGTGLNALLTLETAGEEKRAVHYTGIELYPLSWEEVDVLNYSDNPLFKKLHTSPWNKDVNITSYFTLHKVQGDVSQVFCDRPQLLTRIIRQISGTLHRPLVRPRLFRCLCSRKATGNVERRAFPEYICRYEYRWNTDYILCKRRYPPPSASSRIYCRTAPRSARRQARDTPGIKKSRRADLRLRKKNCTTVALTLNYLY